MGRSFIDTLHVSDPCVVSSKLLYTALNHVSLVQSSYTPRIQNYGTQP